MARTMPSLVTALLVVVFLVLVPLSASPAAAWWGMGHMTVAEVARRHMKESVTEKAETAAAVFARKGPFPLNRDLTQGAMWPDDAIAMGLRTMSTWHYITVPYIPEAEADTFHLTMSPIAEVNAMTVIKDLVTAIKSNKATADSVASSIVNLVHYTGDLHQPLHSTNLFSAEYPAGDLGGNRITVIVDAAAGTRQNLHAFWDSMAHGPDGDAEVQRPLTKEGYDAISRFADYLEETYGKDLTDKEKSVTNPTTFAKESNDIAKSFVYKGIHDGDTLSEEYKKQARAICEQRVLLAGYRLAAILNDALAKVPMRLITSGEEAVAKQLREEAANTTTFNHYAEKGGLTAGATVGVALGIFIAAALLAALFVGVVFHMSAVRSAKKKPVGNDEIVEMRRRSVVHGKLATPSDEPLHGEAHSNV